MGRASRRKQEHRLGRTVQVWNDQTGAMETFDNAKVDDKIKVLQPWSTDPTIVAAVKAHNSNMPAEDKAMTDEQKISYAIARQVGENLRSQGLAVDVPTFSEALRRALRQDQPVI